MQKRTQEESTKKFSKRLYTTRSRSRSTRRPRVPRRRFTQTCSRTSSSRTSHLRKRATFVSHLQERRRRVVQSRPLRTFPSPSRTPRRLPLCPQDAKHPTRAGSLRTHIRLFKLNLQPDLGSPSRLSQRALTFSGKLTCPSGQQRQGRPRESRSRLICPSRQRRNVFWLSSIVIASSTSHLAHASRPKDRNRNAQSRTPLQLTPLQSVTPQALSRPRAVHLSRVAPPTARTPPTRARAQVEAEAA